MLNLILIIFLIIVVERNRCFRWFPFLRSNSRRINPMDSTGLIMTRVNCIENSNARWLIIVGREIKWKKVRYKFARFVSGLI